MVFVSIELLSIGHIANSAGVGVGVLDGLLYALQYVVSRYPAQSTGVFSPHSRYALASPLCGNVLTSFQRILLVVFQLVPF
jgi:hypothetical protein